MKKIYFAVARYQDWSKSYQLFRDGKRDRRSHNGISMKERFETEAEAYAELTKWLQEDGKHTRISKADISDRYQADWEQEETRDDLDTWFAKTYPQGEGWYNDANGSKVGELDPSNGGFDLGDEVYYVTSEYDPANLYCLFGTTIVEENTPNEGAMFDKFDATLRGEPTDLFEEAYQKLLDDQQVGIIVPLHPAACAALCEFLRHISNDLSAANYNLVLLHHYSANEFREQNFFENW